MKMVENNKLEKEIVESKTQIRGNLMLAGATSVAVTLSAILLVGAGATAIPAQASVPVNDKCLETVVLKEKTSASPLTAMMCAPYEGHTSFGTWATEYRLATASLDEISEDTAQMVEEDGSYAKEEALSTYFAAAAAGQITPVTIADANKAADDMDSIQDTLESQISQAKEEAAARAAKVAPISDVIDTDGWSDDKIDFVIEWAPRIDSYLSGRTLSGYGAHFAAAAYDYDVDPRVGAAISVIESGGGDVCFRPCNAWGWGSSSWGSWEEAIDGWTQSFNSGYGYDMDASDCARYCPGNGGYYSTLRGQMESV